MIRNTILKLWSIFRGQCRQELVERCVASILASPGLRNEHMEAGWLLTAIGDSWYRKADCQASVEALGLAFHCRNTTTHPVILKRLGQRHCELGNQRLGVFYLQQAMRHNVNESGDKIFGHEVRVIGIWCAKPDQRG